MTLKDIIENCERLYCGSYGVEYVHIPDRGKCDWLRERLEIPIPYKYDVDEKRRILDRLIWSDSFERFLATKYPSDKRFGLEGGESLIPGMKALIDRSVDLGIKSIVIGMPHRGRLNVLSNVIRKPNESIFSEFAGTQANSDYEGSGDVKYHLGMNYERPLQRKTRFFVFGCESFTFGSGRSRCSWQGQERFNISVVMNKVIIRVWDYFSMAMLHLQLKVLFMKPWDFSSCLIIARTPVNFRTNISGGTIHIVVNNQIGFTTDPRFARSTPYATDIGKAYDCPVFHVNGDDAEAITFIHQVAADWRQQFKTDVIIDIICYRFLIQKA